MGNQTSQVQTIKILFAAANPIDQRPLHLDSEIREIQQKILLSEYRNALDVQQIWATRPDDLLQHLNMQKPHIVHFSGHGSKAGEIILVDSQQRSKPVSPEALQTLFTVLKDNVKVVLLNACFSKIQAEAISSVIDCTIGMNKAINDTAAITFAASFYRALGFGRSIQEAFEQGKLALQLEGIPGHLIPELLHRRTIDPAAIYLLSSAEQTPEYNYSKQIEQIERSLRTKDYDTVYHALHKFLSQAADKISPRDHARFKYLEALVHLEGQRPRAKSPSVMAQVENLMKQASELHRTYAYLSILALFKYDFASAGLRKKEQEREAQRFIREAQKLARTNEDTHNLKLLAHDQPQLYQEYRSYLTQQPHPQTAQQKGSSKYGNLHH